MARFIFTIDEKNYKLLEGLSKKTKASKSKILNTILKISQEEEEIKGNLLCYKNERKEERTKEVRLCFTLNEWKILKEKSVLNGHKHLTQELRYIILNEIYKDKFQNTKELLKLTSTKTSINILGRNLNALNRELKRKNLIKVDEKNLELMLKNIVAKIDKLTLNLENIIKKTKDKI